MPESHKPQPKRVNHDSGESCEGYNIKRSETPTLCTTSKKSFGTLQPDKPEPGDRWQISKIGDSPNQPRSFNELLEHLAKHELELKEYKQIRCP